MATGRKTETAYILVKFRDHCEGDMIGKMIGLPYVNDASPVGLEDYDMLLRVEGSCCNIKAFNFEQLRGHSDVSDTRVLKDDMYMNDCGQP